MAFTNKSYIEFLNIGQEAADASSAKLQSTRKKIESLGTDLKALDERVEELETDV